MDGWGMMVMMPAWAWCSPARPADTQGPSECCWWWGLSRRLEEGRQGEGGGEAAASIIRGGPFCQGGWPTKLQWEINGKLKEKLRIKSRDWIFFFFFFRFIDSYFYFIFYRIPVLRGTKSVHDCSRNTTEWEPASTSTSTGAVLQLNRSSVESVLLVLLWCCGAFEGSWEYWGRLFPSVCAAGWGGRTVSDAW